jgi:hypothetical protein
VWLRPANFQFAAKDSLAPVVLAEVGQVGSWMPIAFIKQTERFVPMAMMSPIPEHNLFIAPDGQWLGGFVPTALRSYPFRLIRPANSEKLTLCIDEESGLVADANDQGVSFFTADEKPSQTLSTVMEFLRQVEASRMATDLAMASLAEAGVIEPWPLEVDMNGKKTALGGLYRIREAALGGLDDEAFLKLRKTSGLSLAYAQLMSLGQLGRFEQLMKLRQQLVQTPKIKPEDLFKASEPADLIRFD